MIVSDLQINADTVMTLPVPAEPQEGRQASTQSHTPWNKDKTILALLRKYKTPK